MKKITLTIAFMTIASFAAENHDTHAKSASAKAVTAPTAKAQGHGKTTATSSTKKASPADALITLMEGNTRFVNGRSLRPHADAERIKLAATSNQKDYAIATVLTCSDSRVPPEILFDAGIMDLFIVRVAGNVADVDEIGSIEYGMNHVETPLLVVLGHTQCGAVTAVCQGLQGHGHELERNIPPLVDNITPAAKRAIAAHPELDDTAIIPYATFENVNQSIIDIFSRSPSIRELSKQGKIKVVGAIYDLPSGQVSFTSSGVVDSLFRLAEANPR